MKLLNKLIFAVGLTFSAGSFYRYYILYPDLSQLVIGVSIGLLLAACGYFRDKIIEIEEKSQKTKDEVFVLGGFVNDKLEDKEIVKDGEE